MSCTSSIENEETQAGDQVFSLEVRKTKHKCPIGETVANQNMAEGKIPVFSCEGSCIRGEIARVAANLVAKEPLYRRACHGELFAVPDSAMHQWVLNADKVVLIDGCFLKCHSRMIGSLVCSKRLAVFDALSLHKKYSDRFDIDSVPEAERNQVARDVADWVLDSLARQEVEARFEEVNQCPAPGR